MEGPLGFCCRLQRSGMAVLGRDAIERIITSSALPSCIDYSSCRIRIDTIDARHAEYAQPLAILPQGRLRNTEHGTREFGIIEPHGALMTFFQVMPVA